MLPGDGVAGYARDFGRPDETAHYDHAVLEIIEFGDVTVGRITAQPGWRWSEHMRPVVGGELCEARHVGLVLRGQFGFTFRNGTSITVGTDQVFDVPGGHDGYTVGDEDCVLLEWAGVRATTGFSLSPRHRMLTTLL